MTWSAFAPLNGVLYDAVTRALEQPAEDNLIVVEIPSDMDLAGVGWAELADQLFDAGSRAVAFTFIPTDTFSPFESSAPVYLPASSEDATAFSASAPDRSRYGVVVIPPSQYGVHRTQLTSVSDFGGSRRTLEAAVVGTTDDRPFYVRYPGGIGGIPRVAVEDLLQERVPEELLENRVVLIGQVNAGGVGLTTPINPNHPVMAPLIYHAFALQTLMSDSVPRSLSLLPAAALLLFSTAIGAITYVKTLPRNALSVVLVVTLAILAFGLIALIGFDTVIPTAELLVLQVLLSLLIWRRREELQDRTLQRIARRFSSEVLGQSLRHVEDSERSERSTAAILGLADSVVIRLDERQRFTPAARRRLQDLEMPETVVSGVDPAFAEAARKLTPVQLKTAQTPMLVVPLSREGLIIGYWLIRPKKPESSSWLSSERMVGPFSAAIANFVFSERDVDRRPLKEQIQQDLSVALDAQRSRLAAFQQVLEETSAGLSVRDLLGNELVGTRGFRRELDAAGLEDSGSSGPVDLVGYLAGIDEERSAAALRFVVSERSRLSLPMTGSSHRHAVLNLSWLEQQDAAWGGFLLFQIVDFSQAVRSTEVMRTASEHLGYTVRNDLEAVGLAAALLVHPGLDQQDRTETIAQMGQAIDRARQRLLSIEPFLQPQPVIAGDEVHLLSLEDVLQEVVVLARQNHKIELDMPNVMAAVIAAPEALRTLLRSAIEFLADGAPADAAVGIFVFEEVDGTKIELAAPATGLTQERLKAFLTGDREAESPSLRTMIDAAQRVPVWGGSFDGHSDKKTNVRIVLTLKKLV